MRVTVDTGRCAGLGVCESITEDVFEVGDDGVMTIRGEVVPAGLEELVREAVESCPTQALSWSE